MFGFFTEKVTGLSLVGNEVTLVEVHSAFTLGKPRFTTVITHNNADVSIEHILDSIPLKNPVVIVQQAPVHFFQDESIQTSGTEDILKPLLNISGGSWVWPQGEQQVDTGQVTRAVTILKQNNRNPAGVMSLATAVRHILPPQSGDSRFAVISANQRRSLLAYQGDELVSCRTVQCPESEFPGTIHQFIRQTQKHNSHWIPRHISWFGDTPEILTKSDIEKTIPIFCNDNDIGILLAQAAAVSWLENTSAVLADHSGKPAIEFAPVNRRSGLASRCSVCVFLMVLLVILGMNLHSRKEISSVLQDQQSIAMQKSDQTIQLPGVQHVPHRLEQVRPHRYLENVSQYATASNVRIDDVTLNADRIEIHGNADRMDSINRFSKNMTNFFSAVGADIQAPDTTRNSSGKLTFILGIEWSSAS